MNPQNDNSPISAVANTSGYRTHFKIQGPWNIGQPVHEKITEKALHEANLLDSNKSYEDKQAWEFIRGVIWNDDPEGLLFDHNDTETDNWSSGIVYGIKFKSYEDDAKKGKFFSKNDPLLARSHFGDLQCFHAMASKDKIEPQQTLSDIMEWCYFLFQVSKGLIEGEVLLRDTVIQNWFPEDNNCSVKKNYLIGQKGNLKHRAIGSLMHIIQDSYAKGHVAREDEVGKILEFHSYTNQDADKHGEEDKFDNGKLRPGALKASEMCAEVLRIWQDPNSTWEVMEKFLKENVFVLSPEARASGPGEFK